MSKHCDGDRPVSGDSGCASSADHAENKSACCGSNKSPSSPHDSNATEPEAVSCCSTPVKQKEEVASCCAPKQSFDWIMWGSIAFVVPMYLLFLVVGDSAHGVLPETIATMSHTSFEMMNTMWWGILLGALAVGALGRIPNQMVMAVLGVPGSRKGVVRATMAGLMLDLCNHGILMVAMGLYRKGASLGQVMAFLIASPWNSFTLTLILIALIGLPFTLLFIVCSMVIAWISGLFFDYLVKKGVLPSNPATAEVDADFKLWPAVKSQVSAQHFTPASLLTMFWQGLKESKMVVRWVLFGVVLLALIRAFVEPEQFGVWFGASITGLFLTLLATTVIEVCSEGSSPIAADLVNQAKAPGNGFVFLMAGASTDYTEIMALKDTTGSWKIALFLPLVTVPQVMLIGWLMNTFS
ncbi:permease [Bermanella sp. WJH001]|uniref:permease n=1 Tax=Bermanella sp. WJH001 TaxID=3048005 RepID=UPI0024BE4A4E|nr:permease [Bermanella sp. WJH001]MDJ1536938.1 permease [Bermanella sp. WJH001]